MRFVVFGAGGIGATMGARLHQAGAGVVLIARGAHLEAMRSRGLRFVAPDGDFRLELPVVAGPAEVDWQDGDVVLLTVKSQQSSAALDALLAATDSTLPVVCAQNGVANERMALRRFSQVYGMVVNLPALHLEPGEVVTHATGVGGILDVGRYPTGTDAVAEEVAGWMCQAGFSSRADPHVMRWKYAKLLMNLGNALQAAITPEEAVDDAGAGRGDAERAVLRRLREEALACYKAAGIDCATRDEVRGRREEGYRMVDIPGWPRVGGSSWQSVRRGTGDIETDYLNGEIALLGGLHGVPTPANRVCQHLARRMITHGMPVGSFSAEEIMALLRE